MCVCVCVWVGGCGVYLDKNIILDEPGDYEVCLGAECCVQQLLYISFCNSMERIFTPPRS